MSDLQVSRLLHEATDGLATDRPADVDRVVRGGMARGRAVRRRRRQSVVAAVAVVVVVGAVAGVTSGIRGDDAAPAAPTSTRPVPDVEITVAARDVPGVVGDLLGGTVGPVRTGPGHPLVDEPEEKVVHFLYDGALATFSIEPAGSTSSGAVATTGPTSVDNVTSQSASVTRHGYVVTATSYNATEPAGVDPLSDVPTIPLGFLSEVVGDEVWFGGPRPTPDAEPTGTSDPTRRLLVGARQVPDVVAGVSPGAVTPSRAVPAFLGGPDRAYARFRLDGMGVNAGVALDDRHTPLRDCREQYGSSEACVVQPDGSVLGTSEVTGDDGTVTFRSMSRDGAGFSIFVEVFNTADGLVGSPAVASEPPLSMAELTRLMEPDLWFSNP